MERDNIHLPIFTLLNDFKREPIITVRAKGDERYFPHLIRHLSCEQKWVCPHCLVAFNKCKNVKEHLECGAPGIPCASYKVRANLRPVTSLSLDSETHYCSLGCETVETADIKEIAYHYLEQHTEEELKLWGISRTLLNYLVDRY